jgi:hypothetical protein
MKLRGITGQGIQRVAKTIKGQNIDPYRLDDFVTAYLEAALWSSNDESDESGGEPMDANYGIGDIAQESLAKAQADCAKFQEENEDLLDQVSEEYGADDEQYGHDFWLTRNGHGAGFWDRGYEDAGDELSAAAEKFGELYPYVGDDGKIYID